MSYIIKTANALINAKLTDTGRRMLAQGQLNFQRWAFGDSEIDYFSLGTSFDYSLNEIMRPKDNNPDLKYRIPNGVATTGDTNALPQITPVIKNVVNTARTRGFFTGDTTAGFTAFTSSDYAYSTFNFDVSSLTGGTCLTVSGGTFSSDNVGDLVMLKMSNPTVTATTASGVVEEDAPVPYLMFEIESVTTGATSDYICVDRTLPNFGGAAGTVGGFGILYPGGDSIQNFYGSGSTTPYWNEDTLSFDSNCDLGVADVDVWNMNITNSLPVPGVDDGTYEDFLKYGSTAFTGSKLYFNETLNASDQFKYQPAAGIIHYTNNTVANFYGEQLYVSTADNTSPVLQLPTVMHYTNVSGDTIGLTLSASTTIQTTTGNQNSDHVLRYANLLDPASNVVGYVFPDSKMFVISDMEVNSVMSYKGNRNWTLPSLNGSYGEVVELPKNPGLGVMDDTEDMYVTYLFSTTSGYTTGIHCQNVEKLEASTDADVQVKFTAGLGYMKDLAASGGLGFEAHNLSLVFQKVNRGDFPQPDSWKIYDFTGSVSGATSGPLDPNDIYGTALVIDNDVYTGATTYNLNDYITIPTTAEPENLQFGDERFFYGNVETDIAATVYKTAFNFVGNTNEFNVSQNPTFDSAKNNVYINEVGVYDSLGQLVVIGKLSQPIVKDNTKTIIVQLEIDF